MSEQPEKSAVLLINVGTPNNPTVKDVRRYLGEFLNDPRVIDLPWLARKILVNGIIVPFRAPKSTKLYQRLWTDKGSPLLFHSQNFATLLQSRIGPSAKAFVAMRYGTPSIADALTQIMEEGYQQVIVAPMFPHYASSTTGTAVAAVMDWFNKKDIVPNLRVVGQFFENPWFIESVAQRIKNSDYHSYDHILFSYHGLPKRHVERTHPGKTCEEVGCATRYGHDNHYCYHAACCRTSRLLAETLDLHPDKYSTAFQSRLGKGWLQPFSDFEVQRLAQQGVKRLLVVSPAFVADCLETVVEIGYEYEEIFKTHGGEELTLVESLNDMPQWVDAFADIIRPR